MQRQLFPFSKVLYVVTLCRKCARALTFENSWQAERDWEVATQVAKQIFIIFTLVYLFMF